MCNELLLPIQRSFPEFNQQRSKKLFPGSTQIEAVHRHIWQIICSTAAALHAPIAGQYCVGLTDIVPRPKFLQDIDHLRMIVSSHGIWVSAVQSADSATFSLGWWSPTETNLCCMFPYPIASVMTVILVSLFVHMANVIPAEAIQSLR